MHPLGQEAAGGARRYDWFGALAGDQRQRSDRAKRWCRQPSQPSGNRPRLR